VDLSVLSVSVVAFVTLTREAHRTANIFFTTIGT